MGSGHKTGFSPLTHACSSKKNRFLGSYTAPVLIGTKVLSVLPSLGSWTQNGTFLPSPVRILENKAGSLASMQPLFLETKRTPWPPCSLPWQE
eukprot:c23034_g30_i1 orf=138-416(-)